VSEALHLLEVDYEGEEETLMGENGNHGSIDDGNECGRRRCWQLIVIAGELGTVSNLDYNVCWC
jgi:hypothetical protein